MPQSVDSKLSVAPMMEWTDRHTRYFHRLLTRHARLYTEMVTTGAILFGNRSRFLAFDPAEHPVALQLGGADPDALAECARAGEEWGYDEVNLNLGCPSDRVQSGRFGACLMTEPRLVARCYGAMSRAVSIPITVKSRIGVDDRDSYEELHAFVSILAGAGCRTFIVHARKAWLKGLSPKQNREIPPLHYDRVYRLKADFPSLEIVLNGGVDSLDAACRHLAHVDGVMMGRAAYQDPYMLAEADRRLFGLSVPPPSRHDVVRALTSYVELRMAEGVPLKSMTRHYLGLFNGCRGARAWRRVLSEEARLPGAGPDLLERAAAQVHEEVPAESALRVPALEDAQRPTA